jgi:hypothetical protein
MPYALVSMIDLTQIRTTQNLFKYHSATGRTPLVINEGD